MLDADKTSPESEWEAARIAIEALEKHTGGLLPPELEAAIRASAKSGYMQKYLRKNRGEWFRLHLSNAKMGDPPPRTVPGEYRYDFEKPVRRWYVEYESPYGYGEFLLYYIVRDQSGELWALLAQETDPVIHMGRPEEITQQDLEFVFNGDKMIHKVEKYLWVVKRAIRQDNIIVSFVKSFLKWLKNL